MVYWFGHPNFGAQKILFKFSFSSCVQQKIHWSGDQWFHNASNFFEMTQDTKMRIVEKLMRKRDQRERINCQQKCCHSFNNVIDQASIRFFFYAYSLYCFVWFLLRYLVYVLITFQLSQAQSHEIFLFEYMIFLKVFHEGWFFVMKA